MTKFLKLKSSNFFSKLFQSFNVKNFVKALPRVNFSKLLFSNVLWKLKLAINPKSFFYLKLQKLFQNSIFKSSPKLIIELYYSKLFKFWILKKIFKLFQVQTLKAFSKLFQFQILKPLAIFKSLKSLRYFFKLNYQKLTKYGCFQKLSHLYSIVLQCTLFK